MRVVSEFMHAIQVSRNVVLLKIPICLIVVNVLGCFPIFEKLKILTNYCSTRFNNHKYRTFYISDET